MPWHLSTCRIVALLTCPKPVFNCNWTKDICRVTQLCRTVVINRSFSARDRTWGRPLLASASWHSAEINLHSGTLSDSQGSSPSCSPSHSEDGNSWSTLSSLSIEAKNCSAVFWSPSPTCKCLHPAGILIDWYKSSSSASILLKKISLCSCTPSPPLLPVPSSIPSLDWVCSRLAVAFFRACL